MADSYLKSILEFILNVKFITIDKKAHELNDTDNLITCKNEILEKKISSQNII